LISHVDHEFALVKAEQLQEPVHRVNWPREMQVETELD
jgi:hypothetical protein